jgi:predicted nuclease with TOPRIM domain
VTTLHGERDEAQNRARIWERDLVILHKDHRRLPASFSRLTLRFTNLQAKVLEEHSKFPILRVRDCSPQ